MCVEAAACNRVWWRLQPYGMEAAAACNHCMCWRLRQPYVMEATAACACTHCMCWRLRQPYVMEAATRMHPLQRPAGLMPPVTDTGLCSLCDRAR